MLQCIGNELDDRDLCNLLLVCKATHWKFQDASWWAVRFASVFDKPPVGTYKATALGVVYKTRRKVLRKGAIFKSGLTANERACLNVLIPLCLGKLSFTAYLASNLPSLQSAQSADQCLRLINSSCV